MKKISDERARVKGMQDDTYARMRALKSDKYGKTKVWGENRCVCTGHSSICNARTLSTTAVCALKLREGWQR